MVIFLQMFLTQFTINRLIKKSARNVIIGFFAVIGITTAIFVGFNTYKNYDFSEKKIEAKKPEKKIKKEIKNLK